MKVTHKQATDTFTTLSLSGRILTVDGEEKDLDNLPIKPSPIIDEETGEITNQSEIDAFSEKCYIENGEKILMIEVDGPPNADHPNWTDHQFMFINGNLLRFYDLDNSGVINDTDELENFVKYWNMTRDERTEYHRSVLNK